MHKLVAGLSSLQYQFISHLFSQLTSAYDSLITECVPENVRISRQASMVDTPRRAAKAMLQRVADQINTQFGVSELLLNQILDELKPVRSDTVFDLGAGAGIDKVYASAVQLTISNLKAGPISADVAMGLPMDGKMLGLSKYGREVGRLHQFGAQLSQFKTSLLSFISIHTDAQESFVNVSDAEGRLEMIPSRYQAPQLNLLKPMTRITLDENDVADIFSGKVPSSEVDRIRSGTQGYTRQSDASLLEVGKGFQSEFSESDHRLVLSYISELMGHSLGDETSLFLTNAYTMCEHHTNPFSGVVFIGYGLLKAESLSLSDTFLEELVSREAAKFQTQEEFTASLSSLILADVGENYLSHLVVGMVNSEHTCATERGPKQVDMRTSTVVKWDQKSP